MSSYTAREVLQQEQMRMDAGGFPAFFFLGDAVRGFVGDLVVRAFFLGGSSGETKAGELELPA